MICKKYKALGYGIETGTKSNLHKEELQTH